MASGGKAVLPTVITVPPEAVSWIASLAARRSRSSRCPKSAVAPEAASVAIEASSSRPISQAERSWAIYGRNTTISLSSTANVAISQRRPDRLWRGLTRGGPALASDMTAKWVKRRLTATGP